MFDRHAITQHTRYQFGVVPVLGVELLREALDGGFIATTVLELEIVTLGAIGVNLLNDFTRCNGLGQHNAILVVGQASKYLVRVAIQQAYQCHPFLTVILKTYHVALQHLRTHLGNLWSGAQQEDIECLIGQRKQQFGIIGLNRFEALVKDAGHTLLGQSSIAVLTYGCEFVSNTLNEFTSQVFFHIKLFLRAKLDKFAELFVFLQPNNTKKQIFISKIKRYETFIDTTNHQKIHPGASERRVAEPPDERGCTHPDHGKPAALQRGGDPKRRHESQAGTCPFQPAHGETGACGADHLCRF